MVRRVAGLLVALAFAVACFRVDQAAWLGTPRTIAPGVELYRTTDSTLVDPEDSIAVYLLRLDLDKVQIESVLSNDEVMAAERVDGIAQRHQAIAAVNAGFFNVKNGEPASVLKVAGELVSDATLTRAVVAVLTGPGSRQQYYLRSGRGEDGGALQDGIAAGVRGHRRRRHDSRARQADALHADVPRGYRHRGERHRVGTQRQSP